MEDPTEILLKTLIRKLHIIGEKDVLKKSSEYLRLSEIKLQSISIDTNCRNIICIHLATIYYGLNFDLDTALKLCGLKKVRYTLLKRTFEQFLNINTHKLSITEICIKLNLKNIEKIAIDILEQFSEIVRNKNLNYDLTHPQYAAMAIYKQIGNEKNIKKIKSKLLTFCELTQSQWVQLEEIWNKLLPKTNANNNTDNRNDNNSTSMADNKDTENRLIKNVSEIEDYEIWKTRILKRAYADLEKANS